MKVPFSYPDTPRGEDEDELHGVRVPDPYRWLEDPDAPETHAWVDAQIALTDAFLARSAAREQIRKRLCEVFDFERIGLPIRRGAQRFFFRNPGLLRHPILYRTRTPEAEREAVFDPNALSEDGTVGLASSDISLDGRWLAYAVTDGGTDWNTIRIRDLSTGADLDDEVRWVKFSQPAFLPDGRTFLYSRFPEQGSTELNRNHQIWLHRLGTPQSDDVLVYARPDQPEWTMAASVHDEGDLVVVHVSATSSDNNALFVAEIEDGVPGPIRPLIETFDGRYLPVTVIGRQIVLQTDAGAPRHRLIRVDLDHPEPETWVELVPEAEDVLVSAHRVGDRLFLQYLHDAHSRVAIFDLEGRPTGRIPLPAPGTTDGFDGRPEHRDTFFVFTSEIHPVSIYRYDLDTEEVSLHFAPRVPFDTSDLHTEQIFVDSPDGTKIPAFVSWKGELHRDGTRPTLLYGYGGFNISLLPHFDTSRIPWLEMGGVYVTANLRGGGEYGRAWHEAGTKQRKQNVFDDFVAVAEHLCREQITSPQRLAIHGHSNGGLLVGAVLVQRPELFGAAIPSVGVLDMLRYHLWTIGYAWAEDYGTADDPELFPRLLAYSPVHNARPAAYPPTLVTTADHDDRVVPAHSFKFGAALQHAQQGPAPILMRIERRAGHGASKPLSKVIDEQADLYAFLVSALGMTPGGG